MKNISLNTTINMQTTLLSNIFIDEYMPMADGSYVKVYIYLLRCIQNNDTSITISKIADIMDTSERDIIRAISYWERVKLLNVLRDENDEIISIEFVYPKESDSHKNTASDNVIPMPASAMIPLGAVSSGTSACVLSTSNTDTFINTNNTTDKKLDVLNSGASPDVIQTLLNNEDFQNMIRITEGYLGHALPSTLVSLEINLYTQHNFSPSLIIHLFDYCISKHNGNSNSIDKYIERVGLDWASRNIDTIEKAEADSMKYSETYRIVMNSFGIRNRELGTDEMEYLLKWSKQYGFSPDMIKLACSKTILTTNTPNFRYADSIIEGWKKNNIRSLKDVEIHDEKHKEELKEQHRKSKESADKNNTVKSMAPVHNFNFEQRNYSDKEYESIERRAISKYLQ